MSFRFFLEFLRLLIFNVRLNILIKHAKLSFKLPEKILKQFKMEIFILHLFCSPNLKLCGDGIQNNNTTAYLVYATQIAPICYL